MMTNTIEIFKPLCIALTVILFWTVPGFDCAAQSGKIAGMPQALTVHEGQEFDVTFYVHPGEEPVSVVDFVLEYDKAYLEAREIIRIDSPLDMNQVKESIDANEGRLIYAAFKLSHPWPQEPFALVKVRFRALKETGDTKLFHNPDKFPNTSMAFEGRNTMGSANDVRITIFKKQASPAAGAVLAKDTRFELLHDQELHLAQIEFITRESGKVQLLLRHMEGAFTAVLCDHEVHGSARYFFELDTEVMPYGEYTVELSTPDGKETVSMYIGAAE